MSNLSPVQAVQQAAESLIAAFSRHDTAAYFACFHPEATFLFYNNPVLLSSRKAYEQCWAQWETQFGFHVMDCRSSEQKIGFFGDTAIFTHCVETQIKTNDGIQTVAERESIVFQKQADQRWLCIHEHLSPREVNQ